MPGTVRSGGLSVFEYCYRDAGNFKTFGALLLTGWDPEAEAKIIRSLEWAAQFVAEQIGVPPLYLQHWDSVGDGPSELDHAYHEFICLRPVLDADLDLPQGGTLVAFLDRMQAAAGRWDVRLSPNSDL